MTRDLYGLPLERFVPERTALAKELRRGGDRERADAVAGLRKPSLAAWAVNQLVRTQRRDVTTLFKAGDAARRAQASLLSGRGDGAALREALDREREAVGKLTRAARGLLSDEGHELSPAMLERVADTLHAAALEPEARAQVKEGCLHRELRHVGLGEAGLTKEPAPRRGGGRKTGKTAALRKPEAEARRATERAVRALEAAERDRDSAAETLAASESVLAEARKQAREAESAQRRIERETGTA